MSQSLESLVRHLHLRRGRERRGLTLAEGVRLLEEAVAAGVRIKVALVAPALEATPRGRALAERLRATADRVEPYPDRELAALAATEHPQGVVAVVEPPSWTLDDLRLAPGRVVLVLDGVQDPGNVGTMVRTAWALGAAGVVSLPGTAELTNPKVLRASMGGSFRLPAVAADVDETLDWLRRAGAEVWTAAPDGGAVPTGRPAGPVALVVGNEGAGVSDRVEGLARRRVAVPLAPGAESLNVAVAAGILLYEVLRAS